MPPLVLTIRHKKKGSTWYYLVLQGTTWYSTVPPLVLRGTQGALEIELYVQLFDVQQLGNRIPTNMRRTKMRLRDLTRNFTSSHLTAQKSAKTTRRQDETDDLQKKMPEQHPLLP